MPDNEFGNVETHPFGDQRTPKQVLLDCLAECDSYKQVIVVCLDENDDVRTGWSRGTYLNHIGMLGVAAHKFNDDLRDGIGFDHSQDDEPPEPA